ncbi:MAG: DUF4900 domain-containing protein [Candidatus Omnitrophica bacterium]|nr:DUF4900 domain-containing protein [Candidatus Omnitrophota bacterium]
MNLKNEKGIALIMTLFIVVILIGYSAVFVLRTVHESRMAKKERDALKVFYISEGATEAALAQLDTLINTDMMNTVNAMNPSTVVTLAQNNLTDGINFLISTVKNGGTAQFTLNGTQAEHNVGTTALGGGSYQFNLIVTEKTNPIVVTPDTWDFPYFYRIQSTGTAEGLNKNLVLSGDFVVRVQRDNFAKYALFTNTQTTPGGSNVWFTDKTNFDGPVHTNGRFNFAFNPSGEFNGAVVQYEQLARFYNNGSSVLIDADSNGSTDVPTFNAGFNRNQPAITLSSPVAEQDMIDQATGNQSFATDGIYVPYSGTNLVGGIYVRGDSNITLSVDGNNNAVYTITQGGSTKTITVDKVNNQTTVDTAGVGAVTYAGLPDGVDDVGTVIYAQGNINSIGGTVQQDTALTIASQDNIVITNHLLYANYTAGSGTPGGAGYVPPTANGADNLLGLVSWNGNVEIGTSAPDDINVHSTILAKAGVFTVDNYNDWGVGPRGTATLLGGVISDDYGAFGQFNGSTGQQGSGYGRNFVYDERMETGSAPPYFPSLNTFIASTNDITDKKIWQDGS